MDNFSSLSTRKYITLLTPSWLSVIVSSFAMITAILLHNFADIRQTIGIPHGIDIHGLLSNGLDQLMNRTLGQSQTNTLVLALFWGLVGLIAYELVLALVRTIRQVDDELYRQKTYLWPESSRRNAPLKEFLLRTFFRLITCMLLLLYIIYPLSIVIKSPVLGYTPEIGTLMQRFIGYIVWFIIGLIVWHGLVVLLRLVALKSRLLG